MAKEELSSGKMQCLIAENTVIQGNLLFTDGMHLDGKIVGDIAAADNKPNLLVISRKGRVKGNIKVRDVVIDGTVEGNIQVTNKIKLMANANITGNINYGKIEIIDGAVINGKLTSAAGATATTAAKVTTATATKTKDLQGVA
jgi:cytoskeletal protein CcmA (bactofilin family)